MNIEIGNKKIDFVYQGDNLIYPNYPARENLILHYDFSGRTNLDVQKGIAEDLSGNGNNGVLQNFAYIDESGYLDNALIFDGIDDFITIPKPLIDLDNFTYSEGINVLSFRGDEVATVVDGVVEIGGRNLLLNSNFKTSSFNGWDAIYGTHQITENGYLKTYTEVHVAARIEKSFTFNEIGTFTFSIKVKTNRAISWDRWVGLSILNSKIEQIEDDFAIHSITFSNSIAGDKIIRGYQSNAPIGTTTLIEWEKLEKGNKATDWTPAPEDLETTTFKPLFDKKIKSALYWNRALTDEELLQVYNIQIKRI